MRWALDYAALFLLRTLVTRLERGEVEIAELAAGPDVLSIKWGAAFTPPGHREAPAPPPDAPLAHGDHCPRCDLLVVDASGSLMCPSCGTVG